MQGQRIGYVRVSSYDQNPERQLEQTEVRKLFTDVVFRRRLHQFTGLAAVCA